MEPMALRLPLSLSFPRRNTDRRKKREIQEWLGGTDQWRLGRPEDR